jgi:general nucleoside transport system ATP-binding protein
VTVSAPALRVDGVTKRFGDLVANESISFAVGRGEILALLGENGAGKTTLMNIVFGHYVADAGRVEVEGTPLPPGDPRAALAARVGMVHQHFALAENLTVLDNVMLGTESLWRPLSDRAGARARLRRLAAEAGLDIDPDIQVGRLGVGEKQRVEILKALYRDVRLLILDEPTAVLTPAETDALFAILRRLVGSGLSIVFISHKLGEVVAIADRIVVLRQGRVVLTRPCAGASRAELAEAMVGKRIEAPRFARGAPGAVALALEGVSARGADGRGALDGVDLELRFGEILGIAGVAGNGQSVLADLAGGMVVPSAGRLRIAALDAPPRAPAGFVAAGIGRIPEDRHAQGVVGDMSVAENAVIERLGDRRFSGFGWLRQAAMRAHAARLIERFDIRGATPRTRTRLLSGGNMQKLILGRVLDAAPRIVVAAQPTRGLDVGAVAYVQAQLDAARARGAAILLISEDLEELLAMCDRIAVIYRGRLTRPMAAAELDMRRLGLMMAGAAAEHGHAA